MILVDTSVWIEVFRRSMLSLPCVESPLGEGVFLEAVALYRGALPVGLTPRSGWTASWRRARCATTSRLLQRDRDYAALAEISPLRQRTI